MSNRTKSSICFRCRSPRSGASGITLIELMIVVMILGIIVLFGIPAYRGYAERTHRTEALNAMGRILTAQEQFRLANPGVGYTGNLAALGFTGGCTENCVYNISFDVVNAQTFTARFVPNPAGGTNSVNQTSDTPCSWFTVDALGRRAAEEPRCLESR